MITAAAAGVAAAVQRTAAQRHATTALDRRVQAVRAAVAIDLQRYVDTLQDLSVAAAAQNDLTADDFATITSRVRPERLPGVGALLFATPDGRPSLGRTVTPPTTGADGTAGTDAPDGTAGTAPPGGTAGTGAPGGTAGTDGPDGRAAGGAAAAEAMATARRTGQVAASRLLDAADGTVAVVLAGPVTAGAATPDHESFRGWVLMTLRTGTFLADTLRLVVDGATGVVLTDATAPGRPLVLAGSPGAGGGSGPTPHRSVRLTAAQRTWQLSVTVAGPLVTGVAGYSDELVFGAGLLIAGLLAAMVWLLATSRERALAQVEQATSALRADITRRQAVEAQLRDRESELAGFVAVTAHDLKTPLTNVAAYADLLAEIAAEDLDATCLGFVDRIGSGTRRMTRLIDDLLDFATADNAPLKPEPVDLAALAADVALEHTAHLGDARPNVDIGPLPTVRGDPVALRRLLDNLIGNGIKYVRHGDTAQLSIGARREPDGWRIEVADRGIGVPAEQRQAVFAAFHRDRSAEGYPGTGLGLAICKRIVDRHGGHIGVEANPGGGSRFWFTLPAASPRQSRVPDADAAPVAADPAPPAALPAYSRAPDLTVRNNKDGRDDYRT